MANNASSSSFSQQTAYSLNEFTEYSLWDYQYESFPSTSLNKSSDGEPSTLINFEQLSSLGEEFGSSWDFEDKVEELNNTNEVAPIDETLSMVGKVKKIKNNSKNSWTFEVVSQYFHLPITQAADKLHISEVSLKRVCRKLGIKRWPFRKLRSLKRLAEDVPHYDKLEDEAEKKAIVKELEDERESILKNPNLELDDSTGKLREWCFNSLYKKRRYKSLADLTASNPTANS